MAPPDWYIFPGQKIKIKAKVKTDERDLKPKSWCLSRPLALVLTFHILAERVRSATDKRTAWGRTNRREMCTLCLDQLVSLNQKSIMQYEIRTYTTPTGRTGWQIYSFIRVWFMLSPFKFRSYFSCWNMILWRYGRCWVDDWEKLI